MKGFFPVITKSVKFQKVHEKECSFESAFKTEHFVVCSFI